MSYITPDDLAQREQMRDPWSSQGFVARAQLVRGTLDRGPLLPAAPVPPLGLRRRNWAPVPMPSRFPTDEGYNDVALSGLGEDVAEVMDNLTKELKQNALKAAAINTGIAIALNVVPIVGPVLGLIYSAIQALSGAALQRQGQAELGDFQTEMNALAGQWEARIAAAQQIAFDAEKPAAIKLAVSNTPLEGLGSFYEDLFDSQIFKSISNPIRLLKQVTISAPLRVVQAATNLMENIAPENIQTLFTKAGDAVEWVDDQTDRPIAAVDTAIDTATGMESLNDIRAAIAKARAQLIPQINGQGALALNNIASPNFRENLRKEIAKAIRNSVPFQTVLDGMKKQGMTQPQIAEAVMPSNGLKALPIAGAAGAALLLMTLGS